MASHLLPFLAVSGLLIVLPGPDMALVARNALWSGRSAAWFTAIGVVAGLAVWSLAASTGIAALLKASAPAFLALRIAGAAYLIFLGIQAIRAAFRSSDRTQPSADGASPRPRRSLRQGLLSNLGNPKIAVFFTAFLPQFAPAPTSFWSLFLLGMLFCALTLTWLLAYGALVSKAGDVLRRPRIRRPLEAITGLVLVGFGARLATEPA